MCNIMMGCVVQSANRLSSIEYINL
jgi:hypothetical protein